jgi:RNA polymerase sigma factor (sigma-70 family)
VEVGVNRSLLESVLRRVAHTADAGVSDAELLDRFRQHRDEAAFAAIVRRHGALVWAVCRSLLPLEADAEDAFQATFVALIRSAKSVRTAGRLGPWLHGVACRVALKARRSAARRKQRERVAAAGERDSRIAEGDWDRLRVALHEEVCRLDEPLRTAFVLCELEGVAQGEAAKALGWKLGTLSGRLTKARKLLLDRLGRNGVSAGAAVAAAVTGGAATASVPIRVVARAIALAKSGGDLTGVISTNVLELARGATEVSMTRTKLLAAAVALAAAVVAGTMTTMIPVATAQRPADPIAGEAEYRPQPKGANTTGGDTWTSTTPAAPWEYKFLARPGDAPTFKRLLTDQGSAGWEYCGVEQFAASADSAIVVFKRPKVAASTTATESRPARWADKNDASKPAAVKAYDPAVHKLPPPNTYSITLQHASASQLAKTLDELFGRTGARIVAEPRTNTLLIQGDDELRKAIIGVVEKVDVPGRQDPAK